VTRRQSLALGISKRAIERRLQMGRLHPVHRGVYLVGHTCPMPLAWETAALLACGPHAVLSHRSAAQIWWGLRPEDERYVEVTITRGARRCRYDVRVHASVLHPADVKIRHRLPMTSPERTLIDLGREMDTSWIEWAVGDGRRRGLLTRTSLTRTVERAGPKTGVRAVKEMLRTEGGPAFTRSEAEARLARLLRRAGLPLPEQNVRVAGHEVDFLWREEGLVVEVDGFAYHAGRDAFERDRARDAELQAAGYKVIRITWRQLVETPERVVALIAGSLSGLRPLPGPGAGRGLAAPRR
jgi:very-short-patch-repair endonuclease